MAGGGRKAAVVQPKVQAMKSILVRAVAATAVVVALGAVTAPSASAERRQLGNGSLNICFSVPLPGSADLVWCL